MPMKKVMSKSIMNQSSFSKIYHNTNLKQTQANDDSLEYIETPRSEKRARAFSTQRNGFNNSSQKQIYQNQSQIFKMEESLYSNQSQEKLYNGTGGQFTQQLLNSNFKQSYSDQLYNLQSNETFIQKIKEKQIQDTNELNDIKTSDTRQIWKKGQTINTNSMNLNEIYDDQIDGEQQNKLMQKKIESQLQFYVAQEQLILLVLDYEDQKEIGESYKKQQVSDLYSKLILWDPFFKNFQKNTIKDMCSLFQVKFVFKGDIIYQQYDRVIEFFYFIWSGSVIQQLEIPYEIKNHWPEKGYKEKGTLSKKCKKYKSFLIPERNFFENIL
ncbi:Cyclic nucleotide-binding protein [Pseudocohnilembus persalinus]|uniref:Cyclic nucleotide-binding protein n=1 Tax=Pseudocohnilembus persalinus TaxID=266149 RepID=A0A0V0QET9_PSEPJ|nr:Cyclic nucleotide-binding protein [Pseudocohnilembus persalinus]|eukprot:KRX00709.1 Cyclic nucleotide-binding protein [Pseudocohnilembus persalinus]